MAQKFLSLDEAAKMLGITVDKLTSLRERQKIHGYRDGATWKFKSEEVERLSVELAAKDEDGSSSEGSSDVIALAGFEIGDADSSSGSSSNVIGGVGERPGSGALDSGLPPSDVRSTSPGESGTLPESDVRLVTGEGKKPDSDVKLVPGSSPTLNEPKPPGDSSSGNLKLSDDDLDILALESDGSTVVKEDEPFALSDDSSMGDKPSAIGDSSTGESAELSAGGALSLDVEPFPLEGEGSSKSGSGSGSGSGVSALEDDDLVLRGTGSDVTRHVGDSGIGLASPSDSGLSLEEAPAGTDDDAEALELTGDDMLSIADDSDSEIVTGMSGDSDFLLTPMEDIEESSDSGSQVIALDDTGFEETPSPISGVGEMLITDGTEGALGPELSPVSDAMLMTTTPTTGVAMFGAAPVPEYTLLNVLGLGIAAFLLMLTGMMMYDLVMNMWSWDGPYAVNSTLMDFIVGLF